MKKLFILLFLYCGIVNATTYYVATTGTDGAGHSGAIGDPWLTLAYACTRVTTAGDIIHINAGTYTETAQSVLSAGVSLEGVAVIPQTSIIKAGYTSDQDPTSAFIFLSSASEGTNGNQSISYLKFDGNSLTGRYGIYVRARSNISIHHCTIVDFSDWGVSFGGRADETDAAPTTYATDNQFYSNTITNCSLYDDFARGCLQISGQTAMLIHDNIMSQTGRESGSNGDVITFYRLGYLKGIKIYNNTITKEPYDGVTWDFAIELWNILGGMEIYNNTIIGNTDLCMVSKGTYDYSVDFHHNTVGGAGQPPVWESGFELESGVGSGKGCSDVIVRNNYFKNLHYPIYMYSQVNSDVYDNINIYYNIFDGVGAAAGGGIGVYHNASDASADISNWNIWNNTFYGRYDDALIGIKIPSNSTATNISIRNNIITGFSYTPMHASMQQAGATIDGLSIFNNILYGNGNSNNPLYEGITPTNVTGISPQTNIKLDPVFISTNNFSLQSTSPCINAGIDVGLTTDYEGRLINGLPDIGAYEYGYWRICKYNGKIVMYNGKISAQ